MSAVTREETTWVRVADAAALGDRGCKVVRVDGRQIALFRTPRGILACNNRCPHEGYPLSEGTLDGECVLTCNWHNWKFDLADGRNLYGGDHVRVYPVATRDGGIWLDLAEPPFEARYRTIMRALQEAFDDNDYTRMAREIGRLRVLGADPLDAVRAGIGWSHRRMEFGWTHAFAATADWLVLHDEHADEPEAQVACLLESLAHMADDVLREADYPYAEGVVAWDEEAFVAAVEAEDEAAAAALLRGALTAGLGFAGVERALTRTALAHYNDFGHSLIYVTKARALIQRLGEDLAEPLLLSLLREQVYSRREDLIPEFRGYAPALEAWGSAGEGAVPDMHAFRKLGIARALDEAVRISGAEPEAAFAALLGANALNMLAYRIEQQYEVRIPVSDNVGWLDFTHGITFAQAVREQCDKFPELWPQGLLQLACFSGRNAAFTDDAADVDAWRVPAPEAFFAETVVKLLDHDQDEFIVSAHLVKTTLAARALARAGLPTEVEEAVLAALNRFWHSPLKRKQVRRTVHQALAFVAKDG